MYEYQSIKEAKGGTPNHTDDDIKHDHVYVHNSHLISPHFRLKFSVYLLQLLAAPVN